MNTFLFLTAAEFVVYAVSVNIIIRLRNLSRKNERIKI